MTVADELRREGREQDREEGLIQRFYSLCLLLWARVS